MVLKMWLRTWFGWMPLVLFVLLLDIEWLVVTSVFNLGRWAFWANLMVCWIVVNLALRVIMPIYFLSEERCFEGDAAAWRAAWMVLILCFVLTISGWIPHLLEIDLWWSASSLVLLFVVQLMTYFPRLLTPRKVKMWMSLGRHERWKRKNDRFMEELKSRR